MHSFPFVSLEGVKRVCWDKRLTNMIKCKLFVFLCRLALSLNLSFPLGVIIHRRNSSEFYPFNMHLALTQGNIKNARKSHLPALFSSLLPFSRAVVLPFCFVLPKTIEKVNEIEISFMF